MKNFTGPRAGLTSPLAVYKSQNESLVNTAALTSMTLLVVILTAHGYHLAELLYAQDFPKENYFRKYSDARGDVPLLGDSVWVGSWPFEGDQVPDDVTGEVGYPGYPHGKGYFMGRFCVDRHKKATNIGFVDSRVERVRLEDLWTLRWHKKFKPVKRVSIP